MNHIHSYFEGYYIQIIKVSMRMEVFMYFLKKNITQINMMIKRESYLNFSDYKDSIALR